MIINNDGFKKKGESKNLILNLEIIDELDDVKNTYSYEINQIDFVCESSILKMNYNEYKESLRLSEIMEKQTEVNNYTSKLPEENKKFEKPIRKDMIDYNQVSEILGNLNYLKNLVETNKIKIIDVDGIVSKIDII